MIYVDDSGASKRKRTKKGYSSYRGKTAARGWTTNTTKAAAKKNANRKSPRRRVYGGR